MRRPPRNPHQGLLTRYLAWRIVFVALLGVAGTFSLFFWERAHGASLPAARTVTVNTLVMIEIFYLFNTRFLTAPVLNRRGLTGNRFIPPVIALLIAAQVGFTYGEPLHELFGTTAIGPVAWLRSIVVGVAVMAAVELEKGVVRWLRHIRIGGT